MHTCNPIVPYANRNKKKTTKKLLVHASHIRVCVFWNRRQKQNFRKSHFYSSCFFSGPQLRVWVYWASQFCIFCRVHARATFVFLILCANSPVWCSHWAEFVTGFLLRSKILAWLSMIANHAIMEMSSPNINFQNLLFLLEGTKNGSALFQRVRTHSEWNVIISGSHAFTATNRFNLMLKIKNSTNAQCKNKWPQ